jgi:hypothetical protein
MPPVVGRFTGDGGQFYADEVIGEKKIKVRFIWSDVTPLSSRWEQAFRRWRSDLGDQLDHGGHPAPTCSGEK